MMNSKQHKCSRRALLLQHLNYCKKSYYSQILPLKFPKLQILFYRSFESQKFKIKILAVLLFFYYEGLSVQMFISFCLLMAFPCVCVCAPTTFIEMLAPLVQRPRLSGLIWPLVTHQVSCLQIQPCPEVRLKIIYGDTVHPTIHCQTQQR